MNNSSIHKLSILMRLFIRRNSVISSARKTHAINKRTDKGVKKSLILIPVLKSGSTAVNHNSNAYPLRRTAIRLNNLLTEIGGILNL